MSQDYITEFIEFLQSHGFQPNDQIQGDDKIHRIKVNGERKADLRYKLKVGADHAFGWFIYSKHGETIGWHSKTKKTMTKAEREALNARIEADRIANEQAREKEMLEIAEKARRLWASYGQADPEHPYLKKKGIEPLAIRQNNETLVVPIYVSGQLWSLQYIDKDGNKRFLSGGKTKGGYATLIFKNDSIDTIVICEGYATGVSVRMATGLPVVVAFNAGNITEVAKHIRGKFKESRIIIAADNDLFTMKPEHQKDHPNYKDTDGAADVWNEWREAGYLINAGLEKAIEAAKICDCEISVPEFEDLSEKPTDYNDLHSKEGLDRLRTQIHLTKKPSELESVDRGVEGTPEQSQSDKQPLDVPPDFEIPPTHIYEEAYKEETQRVRDLYDIDQQPTYEGGEVYSPPVDEQDSHATDWVGSLVTNKDGKPISTSLTNIDLILRYHPSFKDLFCYDEFAHQKTLVTCPPWESVDKFKVRVMTDEDITRLAIEMEKRANGIKPSLTNLKKVHDSVVMKKRRHPAREYFSRLEWDGVERLKDWLTVYCGADYDHKDYISAVGIKWLTAAVARVFEGGIKFDHILIFEGEQSAGKSTMLRELATIRGCEYFIDDMEVTKLGNDEEVPKMQGKLIIELAELSGMRKRDSDSLKQAITTQKDTIIRKYANEPTTYPRQFVLAGTINPKDGYLRDSTGNRRFWPVKVNGKIDVAGIKRDKEQLWSEAVHRYKNGEKLFLDPEIEALAKVAQEDRRSVDPWFARVKKVAGNRKELNDEDMEEIWTSIGVKINNRDGYTASRLTDILIQLGYEWSRKRVHGERVRLWIKKNPEKKPEDEGKEIDF